MYIRLRKAEGTLMKFMDNKKKKEVQLDASDKLKEYDDEMSKKKIPFDFIFTTYIFRNNTNYETRRRALQVLIGNFNQRELLVKELARTDIIVSAQDYRIYINFLSKQR